jgi:hypothetical protein
MNTEATRDESAAGPPVEQSHWVDFAGIMLMMSGFFDLVNGFVAVLDRKYYATTAGHGTQLLIFDFAAWGWIWLVIGCVQIIASLGVFVGSRGARFTGIGLACLSILGQLMFVSAFPFWSVMAMILSLLVIYGLVFEARHVPGQRV